MNALASGGPPDGRTAAGTATRTTARTAAGAGAGTGVGTGDGTGRAAAQGERGAMASVMMMILGALAMTSCCILPLTLVSLGVTGVFIGRLSALYQYHWYFLGFATLALAYGFFKAYRPLSADSCADGSCARPLNRTLVRAVMWVSLCIVVAALVFQSLAPRLLNPF